MEENKTNDEVFARALIRILENQMRIKEHIGLVKESSDRYGDCYDDYNILYDLSDIE